jgi:hypothetical protein
MNFPPEFFLFGSADLRFFDLDSSAVFTGIIAGNNKDSSVFQRQTVNTTVFYRRFLSIGRGPVKLDRL